MSRRRHIDNEITDSAIDHASMESLLGKPGFAQDSVYSRFDRTHAHPLYYKLYSYHYYDKIYGITLRTMRFRPARLAGLPARTIREPLQFPVAILYTEAASDGGNCKSAAIFLDRNDYILALLAGRGHHLNTVYSGRASTRLMGTFPDTSTLSRLELTAGALSIYQELFLLANRTVAIYVDKTGSLGR